MKKNKILLLVENLDIVEKLKKESNITFLFPVTDFSVGFNNTFKLEEIMVDAYIFVNRILDNEGILSFKQLILNMPSNIKGIVFDDIGVLNVLNKSSLDITKILFLNHFNCNYESINSYLDYVDSVVVSSDITKEETKEILDKAKKPLVLFTFGHVNIMYSRRTLITNYNKHFDKNVSNKALLEDNIANKKFKIIENSYGTVIYTNEPFNALNYMEEENVLFNFINTVFLDISDISNIINKNNLDKYTYKYLSENKTIFKLKEDKND